MFASYPFGGGYYGQGPALTPVIIGPERAAYIVDSQFFLVPAGSHWVMMPPVGRFFLVPVREPEFVA